MEQNQSSAPRLHPPNTLYNTDGWRRTRKSTSKITVRSAKKQERLKNMERKTKVLLGLTSRRPGFLPSWPRMWPRAHAFLLPPRALPPSPLLHPQEVRGSSQTQTTHWPLKTGWGQHWGGLGGAKGRVKVVYTECAASCGCVVLRGTWSKASWLLSWLAVETSVVQSSCCFTPSICGI